MRRILIFLSIMLSSIPGLALSKVDDSVFGTDDRVPSIFNSTTVHSPNLQMFPKWRDMLARFAKEQQSLPECAGTEPQRCLPREWALMVEHLSLLQPLAKLREVNEVVNKERYVSDPVNWDLPDYWATPFEFFKYGGDCEEFAVAKYMLLKAAGIPKESMRIVVLQDLELQIPHAILEVRLGSVSYVLDNQIKKVVLPTTIHHYFPLYSINEMGWWLHREILKPLRHASERFLFVKK